MAATTLEPCSAVTINRALVIYFGITQIPARVKLGSDSSKEMSVLSNDGETSSRPSLSLDVKLVTYLFLFFGLLGLVFGTLSILTAVFSDVETWPAARSFFGLIRLDDAISSGVEQVTSGTIWVVTSLLLLFAKKSGWYLSLILIVDGMINNWLTLSESAANLSFVAVLSSSALSLLMATVLLARRRQFSIVRDGGEE